MLGQLTLNNKEFETYIEDINDGSSLDINELHEFYLHELETEILSIESRYYSL